MNNETTVYSLIKVRKIDRERWQPFTGIVKNRTSKFLKNHFFREFQYLKNDYQFAIFRQDKKGKYRFVKRLN